VPIPAASEIGLLLKSCENLVNQHDRAMAYCPAGAWHAACDSGTADGSEPSVARQQKDIAMHTSIGAVAKRPFGCRLLAATAGLALGLAAVLPAKAQETIKVGILHSLSAEGRHAHVDR
jgi:hypothetical protein